MTWAPTLRAEIASMFARLSGCVGFDDRRALGVVRAASETDRAALACYSARRERKRAEKLASDPAYAARHRETRRAAAQRTEAKRREAKRKASARAAAVQLAAYRAERLAARHERRAIR